VNISLQGNTTAIWDWSQVFGDRTFWVPGYIELYVSRNQDLLLGATVILANNMSMQELNQLISFKLLTSCFLKIFGPLAYFPGGQMSVFPPTPADAHGSLNQWCS